MASTFEPTNTTTAATTSSSDDQSLKLAVAVSLLRSKLLQKQPPVADHPPDSDALRWKRKAKERKQEILRLREDLKEAEDASHCDLFPKTAVCKCYFFDNLGRRSPNGDGDVSGSGNRFNDVIRRRFLRQELNSEDEVEQLRASVDFLVELCDSASPMEDGNFAEWSHQAVDFILASLKNLLSVGNKSELLEGIISSLIMHLIRRMCSPSQFCGDESSHFDTNGRFQIQHMIRKLGSESYIGQRAILSISQQISVVAENLLFLDPFDDAFPNMHECLFIMIQLIEFLILDYLLTWARGENFDTGLFEDCMASILHARKALELLENRNVLYGIYMDRVVAELAKHVDQVPAFQRLNQDILRNLFH
ncbi:hypothetical protein Tsubulata_008234 [Turnera subulata]|uniref:Protein MULTIPOLAR SPINDLE 1 n=1 Tax=Turnera subulata TaxID=218843 RepID=A0A9Q0GB89_9ROSI|nr:hypothetical protein Tsubulata_008234 [Turnera subulata]